MITISEEIHRIVMSTPFLEEGLRSGIINLSSLARKILPEIKKSLEKNVTESAMIMALKRYSDGIRGRAQKGSFEVEILDLTVRSNLAEYTFAASENIIKKQEKLIHDVSHQRDKFLTFTRGIYEVTLIISEEFRKNVDEIFKGERKISSFLNLSAVILRLHPKTVSTPGVHYSILKQLAWSNINVIEVVSTYTEFTVIIDNARIDTAFSVLKNLMMR